MKDETIRLYDRATRARLVIARGPTGYGTPARWRVFPNGPRTVDYQEGGELGTFKTAREVSAFLDGFEAGCTRTHLGLAPLMQRAGYGVR